jgi:hypothetical protein
MDAFTFGVIVAGLYFLAVAFMAGAAWEAHHHDPFTQEFGDVPNVPHGAGDSE